MTNLSGYKIAIIGGSIAGCAAAILLKRLGAEIKVFERSPRPLTGRGAGIGLPENLIQQCIALDLFDADLPRILYSKRIFAVKDDEINTAGREIWQQAMNLTALNWSHVYLNLRKRIADSDYLSGVQVKDLLEIKDFDFIIAADGIDSFVRNQIFPECTAESCHYVAWRGTLEFSKWSNYEIFLKCIPYYVFTNGHALFYRIPDLDSQNVVLNWLVYENYQKDALEKLLIDNQGLQRSVSLPPGSLTDQHFKHFHQLTHDNLPADIAKLINQTQNTFLQVIFDLQIPSYVKDNICFVGDAASVLRPHTGSGVVKALNDAIKLSESLSKTSNNDISTQLAEWNKTQLEFANHQVILSKNMGEALVTHTPEWSEMDTNAMDEWWAKLMSGRHWYTR